MISKYYVIEELSKIASILLAAPAPIAWGGKDEATGGVGYIHPEIYKVLNKIGIVEEKILDHSKSDEKKVAKNNVSEDKTKLVMWKNHLARFNLSGDNRYDIKNKSGKKSWTIGTLPGFFMSPVNNKKIEFKFIIDKKSKGFKVSKYSFETNSEKSEIVHSFNDIEETFYSFFKINKDATKKILKNTIADHLNMLKGNVINDVKEHMGEFISPEHVSCKVVPNTKNYIYMSFFAPKIHITDKEKTFMTVSSLEKMVGEVENILKDFFKDKNIDNLSNKVRVSAEVKENTENEVVLIKIDIL